MEYPNDNRFTEPQENTAPVPNIEEEQTQPAAQVPADNSTHSGTAAGSTASPQWAAATDWHAYANPAPASNWSTYANPAAWQWDPEKAQRKAMRSAVNRAGSIAVGSIVAMNVLAILFMLLIRNWLQAGMIDYANGYEPIVYWFQAFLSPVALLLPAVIYLKASHKSVAKLLKFEKGGLLFKFLLVLLGVAVALVANIPGTALQNILESWGFESGSGSMPVSRTWQVLVPYILSVAVIAPLFEEFVFRGVILSSLEEHGQAFAVVVSGVLFGMMHGDLAAAVVASISGMFFGLIYIKSRNLWVTVAIHAVYNSISLFSSFASEIFGEETAVQVNNLLSLVPLAMGVVALILILTVYRKKIFGEKMRKRQMNEQVGSPAGYMESTLPSVQKKPESPSQITGVLLSSIPFWASMLYIVFNFLSVNMSY